MVRRISRNVAAAAFPRFRKNAQGEIKGRRSLIFNEPEYGGDRSYGVAIDSHPYGKIAVFGLPKSGNVWLKSLLSDYFSLPGINLFSQLEQRGVGVSHQPYSPEIAMRADIVHGVCIIRDIRDVIASFFHYTQTERFRSARKEFHYDDIHTFYFDWFLSIIVPQNRWHTFAEEYARMSVPIIRYERLYDDAVEEIRRLVLHWGLEFDRKRAESVVRQNSLEALKKTGKNFEIHVEGSHFRKGGYGNFKNELPEYIVDDISERFAEVQKRWGYS